MKCWKPSVRGSVERGTCIRPSVRRCARDTCRVRWCWADGGGVAGSRPGVRSVEARELKLPSGREWSARDPLEARALEQMVLGVSTRRYARSLEPLPAAVAARGTSKSAGGERVVYGTERKLGELLSRDLHGL